MGFLQPGGFYSGMCESLFLLPAHPTLEQNPLTSCPSWGKSGQFLKVMMSAGQVKEGNRDLAGALGGHRSLQGSTVGGWPPQLICFCVADKGAGTEERFQRPNAWSPSPTLAHKTINLFPCVEECSQSLSCWRRACRQSCGHHTLLQRNNREQIRDTAALEEKEKGLRYLQGAFWS